MDDILNLCRDLREKDYEQVICQLGTTNHKLMAHLYSFSTMAAVYSDA